MPFTPFHLGPGAAFKAIGGRNFSFMVFGGTQVLIDLEPLIGIIRGWDVLHGYSHTIAGALAIGTVAGFIGKPISVFVLDLVKIPHYPLSWRVSFASAYVGTFSHLALDAIMHADMRPWWPLSDVNGILGIVSLTQLHLSCAILGVLGATAIGVRAYRHGRA